MVNRNNSNCQRDPSVETPKKLGEWEPTSAGPKREHVRGSRGSNWVQKLRTTFEKIQLVELWVDLDIQYIWKSQDQMSYKWYTYILRI